VSRLRLGIDLDGVVAEFNGGWMARYNAEFGATLTPDLVQRWDGLADLTHFDHMGQFWRWAKNGDGPSIFRDLLLIDGAKAGLDELALNHDIVIITAKPRCAIADTSAWLGHNEIPTREVHITSKKHEVDCHVYVEDSPHQLPNIVAARPEAMVFRMVQAWNKPVPGAHDIESWEELTAVIDSAGSR